MIDAPTAPPGSDGPLLQRTVRLVRNLPQRLHQREFWITQAAVLAVTATHILAELWASQIDREVPTAFHHVPVVLYLIPISYASMRFGTEGAVLTGLWSALLTVPNLLIWHQANFEWLEFFYVAVVIAVGTIISVPVERERRQRWRAEATSQRLELLDGIATLTLTADLGTTLDTTLRRLLDVLDVEGACVAVDRNTHAPAELSVLACQPHAGPASDALTACVQEHQRFGERSVSVAAGQDIVVVPLVADLPGSGPDGRVNGLLGVKAKPERPITEDDHRVLVGVASHVAVAIANERLTESERNRLRSYARSMIQAQEEERKRIARELHDEAAQNVVVIRRSLAALAANLDDHPAATELSTLRDLAGRTLAEMRRFSRDLRPPTLDELGLSSALDQLVTEVRERSGITGEFRIVGPPRRLPIETELAFFRIGQAALHNVERHAGAARADVELVFEPGSVRMTIADDGCGFDAPEHFEHLTQEGKLGLVGMHERTRLVGGTLDIHSQPYAGTRIHLQVPAEPSPAAERRT